MTSRLHYVQQRFGQPGLDRLLAALPPEDRAVLEANVLPHAWVPMEVFLHLNEAADGLFGSGDLQLCVEMGAWAAEANLPRLFRLFYRLGSPMFVFENAAKLWNAHYDSGRLKAWRDEAGAGHVEIHEFATPHRAHCLSVLGWARKSAELSGEKVVRADELRCRTRGDPHCELLIDWGGG